MRALALSGLYPSRLSPVRDVSDNSDPVPALQSGNQSDLLFLDLTIHTLVSKKSQSSKIPVSSQAKRSPSLSPESVKEQDNTREMELIRTRQQLELNFEISKKKINESFEIETEKLRTESTNRIAELKESVAVVNIMI